MNDNDKERKTRIANKIINNMIEKYSYNQISKYSFNSYMAILNAAYTAYYARRKDCYGEDYGILDEDLNVKISYSKLKDISFGKNVTKKEFDKITDSINILVDVGDKRRVNLFTEVIHHDKDQVLEVVFNDDYFELALLVVENSTSLDVSVFKNINSKYDYFIYCKYCEYKSTGKIIFPINKLKEELNIESMKTKEVSRMIDKSLSRLKKIGIEINKEVIKHGRNITHINFNFKPWCFNQ